MVKQVDDVLSFRLQADIYVIFSNFEMSYYAVFNLKNWKLTYFKGTNFCRAKQSQRFLIKTLVNWPTLDFL